MSENNKARGVVVPRASSSRSHSQDSSAPPSWPHLPSHRGGASLDAIIYDALPAADRARLRAADPRAELAALRRFQRAMAEALRDYPGADAGLAGDFLAGWQAAYALAVIAQADAEQEHRNALARAARRRRRKTRRAAGERAA